MTTNVYCNLCELEVTKGDSFVIETRRVVGAFHYQCGAEISIAFNESLDRAARGRAIETAVASGDLKAGDGTKELPATTEWRLRQLTDRVEATEDLTRKVASVWRLWLNDAARGSINTGTFEAMRTLMGMEKV